MNFNLIGFVHKNDKTAIRNLIKQTQDERCRRLLLSQLFDLILAGDRKDQMEIYLEQGGGFTGIDDEDPPLIRAAYAGSKKIAETLLLRGCLVDIKNKIGQTPLMLACKGGHLSLVQFFLIHGASTTQVDLDGRSALHWLLTEHDNEIICLTLLKNGAFLNQKNNAGHTPADYSRFLGRRRCLEVFDDWPLIYNQ